MIFKDRLCDKYGRTHKTGKMLKRSLRLQTGVFSMHVSAVSL